MGVFEFDLDPTSPLTVPQQLARQVRQAVRLGTLREGETLPPIDAVSRRLGVGRGTVGNAYRDLGREGFVTAVGGSGTWVTGRYAAEPRAVYADVGQAFERLLVAAQGAGLDDETVDALYETTARNLRREAKRGRVV